MATTRVKLNRREIQKYLDGGNGVREDLTARAERVRSAAAAAAPVDTGAYVDSLEVIEDRTDRAVLRVRATVPYAGIVEARLGVLARALDAGR